MHFLAKTLLKVSFKSHTKLYKKSISKHFICSGVSADVVKGGTASQLSVSAALQACKYARPGIPLYERNKEAGKKAPCKRRRATVCVSEARRKLCCQDR